MTFHPRGKQALGNAAAEAETLARPNPTTYLGTVSKHCCRDASVVRLVPSLLSPRLPEHGIVQTKPYLLYLVVNTKPRHL